MAQDEETDSKLKKRGKGMLLGLAFAVVAAAGGFFATYTGMLPPGGGAKASHAAAVMQTDFVAIDPLTISLGPNARARHLRLAAHLEIAPGAQEAVLAAMPRIQDVLNTYLRAVSETDLESPAMLDRLRAQMLHRVQVVSGEGLVRDFLISEFVLN